MMLDLDGMASSELLKDYRSMDHFILKLMRVCELCHTVLTYLGTILCVFSIAKDGRCRVRARPYEQRAELGAQVTSEASGMIAKLR